MYNETYKRLKMSVTEFDAEDVITTSELDKDYMEGEIGFPGGRSTAGSNTISGAVPGQ